MQIATYPIVGFSNTAVKVATFKPAEVYRQYIDILHLIEHFLHSFSPFPPGGGAD